MTTKEMQDVICKHEILKSNLPCQNVSFLFPHEVDVLSLSEKYLTEFEVKVSRSDFKADLKKAKWVFFHNKVESHIPNYFYYACPSDLIAIDEIPDFAGLIYINDAFEVCVVKKANLLHSAKKDKEKILNKFARVLSQRSYLGCCLITYQNRKNKEERKRWEEQKKENTKKFLDFVNQKAN